jgi:hypothetical protein
VYADAIAEEFIVVTLGRGSAEKPREPDERHSKATPIRE